MPEEEPGYPRLEIAFNKKSISLLILYNLLILGICAYLLFGTAKLPLLLEWLLKLSAIVGIFFFGSSILLFARKLWQKAPGFVIDRDGFIDRADAVSSGRIYWKEVTGISQWHFMGQLIIVVKVMDPRKVIQKQSLLKRLLMHFNNKRFGTPVTITSGALKMDNEKLFQLIKQNLIDIHGEPNQ